MFSLPKEWKRERLGNVCQVEIGGTPSRSNLRFWAGRGEEGFPWVAISDLGPKYIQETAEQITQQGINNSSTKLVPQDTILMSFKLTLGKVGIAGKDLYTNEAIAAFYPTSEIDKNWLFHILPRIAESGSAEQAIKGKTLNKSKLQRLSLLLPPLPEQRRIAEVLDAADDAIRQTERVIAKLRQVKQGLLHDLLTRGLDADGNLRDPVAHPEQFKDSALGRVPREWEECQLSDLIAVIRSGLSRAITFEDIGLPVITSTNIVGDQLDVTELKYWYVDDPQGAATENYILDDGDILLNFINSIAQIGKSCLFHDIGRPTIYTTNVFRIKSNSKVDPEFLWRLLQSNHIQSWIQKITKPAINQASFTQGDFLNIPTVVPKFPEQRRIAAVLDAHDARIRAEEAVLAKRRQIKRGLMDDLLTGRVRV
jgi:type I restriction enzyme S subunit